ncbi:hypothetical protein E1091_00215 [Micromonospora fluostatini]|uniref:Uncharacterized protein n=1 Tax=Micromonospora fluostatini TaxID=1629071 RepID=A0ABY2DMU8_9ACTN|nr:hypothetical protein E1091_00215 [Micromonospora fluostatini]
MQITVALVRAELERVAAERPDHRDGRAANRQPCRYLTGGEPSCLVALVLHRLGVSVGVLRALDHEVGRRGAGVRINESRHPALRRVEPAALALLAYVQRMQDSGHTWGQAVEDALSEKRRYGRFARPWMTPSA